MSRHKEEPPGAASLLPLPRFLLDKRAGAGLAVAYALVLLYFSLRYHVVGDYGIETDFFWDFVPTAREFLNGHIKIEEFRGPAYPILLAVASRVTGDFFQTGVILAVLSGGIGLFFCFGILRNFLGQEVAVLGTLIIASNSVFVQYSYSAGTDMVFFTLVTASAYFLFVTTGPRLRDLVLSALCAALAYLTRYNGIFVVAAVPLVFLAINPDASPLKNRLRSSGIFLAVFFLAIAPWGIYCLVEKGSFFYSKNYLNIAYEMFAKGSMSWDQYWNGAAAQYTSLGQVVFADIGLFLKTVGGNAIEHFLQDMNVLVGWHAGVVTIAGVLVAISEKLRRPAAGFLLYSLVFFSVLLLVFYSERFSLFLLTAYIVLAMHALTGKRLRSFRLGRPVAAGGVIAVILLVWTGARSIEFNRGNIDSGPKEVLVIADWFRRNTISSGLRETVIARKPHPAYYLDMNMGGFPYVNTMEELLREAQRMGARYLYFGLMEAAMRPQFQFLLDPTRAPSELRPLVYTNAPPAVLYEIVGADTAP